MVNTTPTVTVTPTNATICAGQSVPLVAGGATSYSWSPAAGLSNAGIYNPTASPATTTTYTVAGSSSGCSNTAAVVITVKQNPVVSVSPSSPSLCEGDSVHLTATGASNYSWSPSTGLSQTNISAPWADPAVTSTFTVMGTTNGCADTMTVTVMVNPIPSVIATASDSTLCSGTSVTLTASGAGSYLWSPSVTLNNPAISNPVATPVTTTTYTVLGTSSGCTASDRITLYVYPSPLLNAVYSIESCAEANDAYINLTVSGGTVPYSLLWNTGDTTVSLTSLIPGTYTVIATDKQGCSDTRTIEIDASEVSCYEPHIYLPNIFSPNGDGNNDLLFVRGKGIVSLSLLIYDRWGEKIFETSDQSNGWDGTFRGKDMDAGVFFYFLRADLENGVKISNHGSITLVK
jgi:trimeric autotransporter adhesin